MLGVVLGCHEGTIGYDRLFLKYLEILFFVCCQLVNNFLETGSNHEPKRNTLSQAFGTLARHSFKALSWHTL